MHSLILGEHTMKKIAYFFPMLISISRREKIDRDAKKGGRGNEWDRAAIKVK